MTKLTAHANVTPSDDVKRKTSRREMTEKVF
jgi:hypothetical protein